MAYKSEKISILICLIASLLILSCNQNNSNPSTLQINDTTKNINSDTIISYSKDIVPILSENCYSCHGNKSAHSGGIWLEGFDHLKIQIDDFAFYSTVFWVDSFAPMPYGGNQLDSVYLKKIDRWLKAGAKNN